MEDGDDDIPTVTVLILGEPGVGKSTFLSYVNRTASTGKYTDNEGSRLTHGEHVTPAPPPRFSSSSSSTSLKTTPPPPPFASSASLPPPYTPSPISPLPDAAQPVTINLVLRGRRYRLRFFDTSSPTPFPSLSPDVLVLAFDVSRRRTLLALQARWLPLVDATPGLNADERAAVLVLGLKRDRRGVESYRDDEAGDDREGGGGVRGGDADADGEGDGDRDTNDGGGGGSVMPHEAVAVAQAMRCDRYAECSARTGELCGLVVEDLAKMAAAAVEERGGRTQGGCCVM